MIELPLPHSDATDHHPLSIFTAPRHRSVDPGLPGASSEAQARLLIPRATYIDETFYPTRRDAVVARCSWTFQSSGTGSALSPPLIIAVDTRSGTGSKLFNVLQRDDIPGFIEQVPPTRRNFYVVIDPSAPCDPFFDVDANFPCPEEEDTSGVSFNRWRFALLDTILLFLVEQLQAHFSTKISSVVVYDASLISKVSFHIHIRMSEQKVFNNMHSLKNFVWSTLAPSINNQATHGTDNQSMSLGTNALDLSVYTSWRLFRLPHCSKRKSGGCNGQSLKLLRPTDFPDGSFTQKMLLECDVLADDSVVAVGSPQVFRGLTECESQIEEPQEDSLLRLAKSFEVALITRRDAAELESRLKRPRDLDDGKLQQPQPMPPFRTGLRQNVTDPAKIEGLIRLFQSLDAHFDPKEPISVPHGGGVTRLSRCEYEDNGAIRMYYAFQKQSRWCFKLQRPHRSTHGQLYVTYSSIKYRCFSNDCHTACAVVPWSSDTIPIRDLIFPMLSEELLRMRYPEQFGEMSAEEASEEASESLTDLDLSRESRSLSLTIV